LDKTLVNILPVTKLASSWPPDNTQRCHQYLWVDVCGVRGSWGVGGLVKEIDIFRKGGHAPVSASIDAYDIYFII